VFLEAVLVVLFLVHIVFVNLMVGGSVIGLGCQVAGRRRRDFDTLAREIAGTITVNKSLAVVLGVAPLLAINALYTVYFYSANALTGGAWISVVPVVAIAFLIGYAHKYSWDRLANRRGLHLALGASATALFLAVPLIFLANINLMLFPGRWAGVSGFLSTLMLPNVLPRYVHFVLACIALTALFLLLYLTRPGYRVEERFESLTRPRLRRGLYGVAFVATLLQLGAGPLVYFTLPDEGMSWYLTAVIVVGIVFGAVALWLMWWEITSADERIGRLYVPVVGLIMCTGFCMGYGRHVYRETAIEPHRAGMAAATDDFYWASLAARSGMTADDGLDDLPAGPRLYRRVCSSCHAVDRVLVGPPLTEIAGIYAGQPEGIVTWTKNPGKKRAGMIQMPAFRLPDDQLRAVAEYMIELGSSESGSPDSSTTAPGG
jgi:cytochrome c